MVSPGRPRLITTDRIVDAGRRITLPQLSIRGVARELGVSEMSIYRVAGDLEGLRAMVAEGIVAGHTFPEPTAGNPEDALVELGHALRDFVIVNPGIGQHLTRLSAPRHDFTIRLAEEQQAAFATRFGYPRRVSWYPPSQSTRWRSARSIRCPTTARIRTSRCLSTRRLSAPVPRPSPP